MYVCTGSTEKHQVGKGLERFLGCASCFLFSSCWRLEPHRKWEGVVSFFGIVTLRSRKPILTHDWYGYWYVSLGGGGGGGIRCLFAMAMAGGA